MARTARAVQDVRAMQQSARAAAQAARASGDQAGVLDAAKKILDLVPDDPEAAALLEQARPAPAAPPTSSPNPSPPPSAPRYLSAHRGATW